MNKPTKISFKWLEAGQEIELTEMKVEGHIEVAKLTAQHDEYVDYVEAITNREWIKSQVTAIEQCIAHHENSDIFKKLYPDVDDDPKTIHSRARSALKNLFGVTANGDDAIYDECQTYKDAAGKEYETVVRKASKESFRCQPYIIEKASLQGYYLIKAYFSDNGKDIPFTYPQFKQKITDGELAVLIEIVHNDIVAKAEERAIEPADRVELQKNLTNGD